MPTDHLAAALRDTYTPTELAALHQQLVDQLDADAPQDDPLGRLCDALHTAAYPPASSTRPTSTGTTTAPTVYATHGTRA